jgi:hypothetical protein
MPRRLAVQDVAVALRVVEVVAEQRRDHADHAFVGA